MRDIKFRAWSIEENKWIYEDIPFSQCYLLKLKHISQYIGLKDKNDVEIYEGDILRGSKYPFYDDDNHNYFGEVFWNEEVLQFMIYTHKKPQSKVVGRSHGNCETFYNFPSDSWEVIGNIYENLELIGGN